MKFKDLFDRDILGEATVRKNLKIFYRIDLDLFKNKAEEPQQQTQQPVQDVVQQTAPTTPEPATEQPPVDTAQQPETPPEPPQETSAPENNDQQDNGVVVNLSSVVTEDDELSSDNERVMRKFANFDDGIQLSDKEEDMINSFQDILDKLSKTEKDGTPILDDFCIQVINLLANKKYDEIKNMLDKKSKIFIEICYGFNKTDSAGIRFNKTANSDTITSLMLVDNKIISMPFSIDKFNEKIVMLRNDKVSNT